MEKKIHVKEFTSSRFHQTEPVPAIKTDNGFKCPNCENEIVVGRDREPDGTIKHKVHICKNCGKRWEVLLRIGQVTNI